MTSTCNMGWVSFFARFFGSAGPREPKTPFEAGVAALERSRLDEALAHFTAALPAAATGAGRALILNKQALVYLQRGDRPLAIAAFVEALGADGQCAPVIVNLGNLLLEDGVLDDAVAHYEAALRLDDGYAPAHLNLGIAYKRLGRHAEAVRHFRRADRIEARRSARRP